MSYVDPNAPTQLDPQMEPAPAEMHYDQYGRPIQPAQPVQPVQPVEPAQYVQPVQPVVEHVQYAQPVEPVEYAAPMEYAQPVEPVTPVEPGEPLVPANRAWDVYRASQVVYLVLGVIEALILVRVILRLLAANPDAGFTSLIYGLTFPFVAPFAGVFPSAGAGGSVLELSSLLAIVVYALLAWAIVRIIHVAAERNRTLTR